MINNSYRTNTGVDRNNRLWNGSAKGGYKWFEPSKYGLNQNYSSPNNVSLFPEDDKKIGLNSKSASKIDTKNGSISPGSASEIRNTLLSMSQNEKTQDYLSSLNDDELEQNYKLAEESLNIGLLQGRYLPPDPSYLPATAASLSFYDRGDTQAQKYFSDIAHGKSDNDEKKATSQAVQNTSSTVDTSFMTFSNTSNSSADYKAKIDDYNRKNKPKQEFKYADEKKSESFAKTKNEKVDEPEVVDISKETSNTGLDILDLALLTQDSMHYRAAVLDETTKEKWLDTSVGTFINTSNTSDKEAIQSRLSKWKKLDDIYKYEGLDISTFYTKIEGELHIVVVNSGSEALTIKQSRRKEMLYDWSDNLARYFVSTDDIDKSIKYANELVERYPEATFTFVGYSKGGAEAAANALATGKEAVLFNPAALRNWEDYGLSLEHEDKITSYIVAGEALSMSDAHIGEGLIGNKKYIGVDKHANAIVTKILTDFIAPIMFGPLATGAGTVTGGIVEILEAIKSHYLESVIKELEKEH